MKFECKDLERALETPELLPDAREHARNCPACRRDLWLWSEMSSLAPGLREQWDTPGLWPKIQQQLQAEPKRRTPRRINWYVPAAIAAAVLLTTSVVWLANPVLRSQRPAAAPATQSDRDFLTDQALKEVEQSEAAYNKSIDKLSQLAKAKLASPESALTAAYREKLDLLDSAIADLRATIAQNQYNARLQLELAALYKEKQQTLQEIVRHEQKN